MAERSFGRYGNWSPFTYRGENGSLSFGSEDTERIWHEQYVKSVDREVQRRLCGNLSWSTPGGTSRTYGSLPGTVWSDSSAIVVGSTVSE